MDISIILYFLRYFLIVILSFVINYLVKRIYHKRPAVFQAILSFVICLIILLAFFKINLILHPLDIDFTQVKIATMNNTNPKVKELTYNADIYNRTNKDVDAIITFTRIDSDLYPYINLIPKTYTSDKITIKAKERINYSSSFTVNSEDSRLINSYYPKIKVKYIVQ